MRRSGSTLVFQITRALLEAKGDLDVVNPKEGLGVPLDQISSIAANSRPILTKIHTIPKAQRPFLPRQNAKYIYTARDPRDAVASLIRKGRVDVLDTTRVGLALDIAKKELTGAKIYSQMPDLWTGFYEEFVDNIPALISALAKFLDVTVNEEWIEKLAVDLDIDKQRERSLAINSDPGIRVETRLTSNHITDGRVGSWRETLTETEVSDVERIFFHWMLRNGYRPSTLRVPGQISIVSVLRYVKSLVVYYYLSVRRA